MKLNSKYVISFCLVLLALLLAMSKGLEETPVEKAKQNYLKGLNEFYEKVTILNAEVIAWDGSPNEQMQLQAKLAACRTSFKEIEYLLDYLQPQDVKDHINGAPLPKTERNVPRVQVLAPKGLQRIEELIYAEDLSTEYSELKKLSAELQSQTLLIRNFARQAYFTDRQLLEAIRHGFIRIMSLGLTGFDTPASDEALIESKVAWEALQRASRPYLEMWSKTEAAKAKQSSALYEAGAEYLNDHQNDFKNFDRAYFIRQYLNPLFRLTGEMHLGLNYETAQESLSGETPLNYYAKDIFADDLLNVYYYTALQRDTDNPAARDLGKLLFFDPILSVNVERSCASCHHPEKAFTDGLDKSLALDFKGKIDRNAPSLTNALFSERFFYDLRADRMESQMEHVIFNPKEFGTNYKTIFKRLESSDEYRRLFAEAFPQFKGEINRNTLSLAITAYLDGLRSFNSPVDRYLRGEKVELDPKVIKGFNLFMGEAACGTCHFAPTFTGLVPPFFEENESEVLGVLTGPLEPSLDPDRGRAFSGRLADETEIYNHSFKTVTVRNVALTAPYFHNGAYPTLESVVDFYNHGGAQGLGLDLPNQTLPPDSLDLDHEEKQAIIAFMKALTDTTAYQQIPRSLPLVDDPRWDNRKVGGSY